MNSGSYIEPYARIRYGSMPPASLGGSAEGRKALRRAIDELNARARELGGNNRGRFVRKYLKPARLPDGNPWCASFVSWCFLEAEVGKKVNMPFAYTAGARALRRQFSKKGWAFQANDTIRPEPGDLVFWWRVRATGWQGHVGFVHQLKDGMLYTIEGNKSPRVQGFSYVLTRMEKLLGFGRVNLNA